MALAAVRAVHALVRAAPPGTVVTKTVKRKAATPSASRTTSRVYSSAPCRQHGMSVESASSMSAAWRRATRLCGRLEAIRVAYPPQAVKPAAQQRAPRRACSPAPSLLNCATRFARRCATCILRGGGGGGGGGGDGRVCGRGGHGMLQPSVLALLAVAGLDTPVGCASGQHHRRGVPGEFHIVTVNLRPEPCGHIYIAAWTVIWEDLHL